MYQQLNKARRENQTLQAVVCVLVIVIVALLVVLRGYQVELRMERYARKNNCEWVYHGTFYGDNRDQTCVKK